MKSFTAFTLSITFSLGMNCFAQKIPENNKVSISIHGIEVSLSAPPAQGDAGSFTRLDIHSKRLSTFKANDAWDIISPEFLRKNKNAVGSKYIFCKTEKEYALLLLWGYGYPSGRDEVTIVSFTPKSATLLHSGNLEEPIKFEDLDSDGRTELICRNEPEMVSGNISVYSPYIIYNYTQSSFSINKALSEAYNKKHYVWAGLKFREDITVKAPATPGMPYTIVK